MSYGAVTVINAIPCGIGAAVGIDLRTKAEFNAGGSGRRVNIINDANESTEMARICVKNTFLHFRTEEPDGWELSVDSQIPISKGLKSSSSACNAVISSVADAISRDHTLDALDIIRLGVRCAVEADVTLTGAFDDACGCHLGGFVMTDNEHNALMIRKKAEENDVILLFTDEKIRKPSIDKEKFYAVSGASRELVRIAEKDWYDALTKNGELVAGVMNIDDRIAKKAIKMGALAAGVSGTGPAISVIVGKGDGASFLRDLEAAGYSAIVTRTR